MSEPLWRPSRERVQSARITKFIKHVNDQHRTSIDGYESLYAWSIDDTQGFWESVWDFGELVGDRGARPFVMSAHRMRDERWFPHARLSYAENLLRHPDQTEAVVFWGEEGTTRSLTRSALSEAVQRFATALRTMGVARGDRVAGYLPNLPESIVAALATASIGAVWSSCSPDFGHAGVIDRFGQIEPLVLVTADEYHYNGRRHDILAKVRDFLPSLPSIRHVVVASYTGRPVDTVRVPNAVTYESVTEETVEPLSTIDRVPFDHPLFVMYSSGTTGPPKCIVHGHGGSLVQHIKEHQLLCDVRAGDRVFYFTTCGWMMWNWLMSALASRATIVLYDGSPFWHGGEVLFELAEQARITLFGASARFIDATRKAGLRPGSRFDLTSVRTITSTGSPLAPEGFDYVYEHVKEDVHLASISGGTDLLASFAGGNPIGPVWRGELQARSLGMAVQVFDDDGNPIIHRAGELVCTKSFPSMPVMFWNDPGGTRYHEAYFDRFPNVWCHGDWVELTEHEGMIFHGRSDAVLNPGGVRIGTAEIYRQVEQLDEVLESICVGQDFDGDVRIILFVRLRPGAMLDDDLAEVIREKIRAACTHRHVPAKIIAVDGIPRTRSGKITELAVRDVINGRQVRSLEGIANPEALDFFRDLPELGS